MLTGRWAKAVKIDEYKKILVCKYNCAGDVVGPCQFTHAATYQAWFAAVNALFGNVKSFKVDYRVIP